MNAPKLRFKEFKDEWQEYKVGEILKISNGINKEKEFFGSGTPIINYMDVNKNELITHSIVRGLVIANSKEIKTYNVKKGDILFTRTSETSDEIGLSSSVIENIDKCIFSGFILKGTQTGNYIHPYFGGYYFRNPKMRKEIIKHSSITTRALTSGSLLTQMLISIPSLNEQEKIGKILLLLDKKIELQSKKIEDLKLFKKGLINSIGKNIEIEKIPLKNILVEQNHKTIKNNEYEILSSTSKGIYLQKDYFNKQAASDNNVGYKILKKNQLVLSPQNLWMGNININSKYNIGIVSPSYKIFDINNNIDIDFFDYWIKSPKALYEYKISSEQGASIVRRNLNMDLFYEIKVDIPKGKMQNKLGKIIKLLNLKIQYNENSLQKLQELKKGLMQNMFV